MDKYYMNVLGQILKGEQPDLHDAIFDMFLENGHVFEGQRIYGFECLNIHQAVQFLEYEWEYLKRFFK